MTDGIEVFHTKLDQILQISLISLNCVLRRKLLFSNFYDKEILLRWKNLLNTVIKDLILKCGN